MADKTPAKISALSKPKFLETLYPLSGKHLINRILDHPDPEKAVRSLAAVDFYWLIKRIGEDEDVALLLGLAAEQQWAYVLDLELWEKDTLKMPQVLAWLGRLHQAAPARLARWLFSEGKFLAHYTLFKNIDVQIRDPQAPLDLDSGFVTFDGIYYIKVGRAEYKDTIEGILKAMADADHLQYQALLVGLAGVIPADLEEEMYRLKNVRLAEHGFLPLEEALPVYAPLDADALKREVPDTPISSKTDDLTDLIPYTPFFAAMGDNLLTQVLARRTGPPEQDRMRLELAGLCNQILSADQAPASDLETLKQICRKAGGYLNLTLETLCKTDAKEAAALLHANPLIHLFRAGVGLALKLKWEATAWLKESWFFRNRMGYEFWPDTWAGTLSGLTREKPLLFRPEQADEPYTDFEHAEDLAHARKILHRMMAIDQLFGVLSVTYPLRADTLPSQPRYDQLLLTFWAGALLVHTPGFQPISASRIKALFGLLRQNDQGPPFEMPGYESVFVQDVMAHAATLSSDIQTTLKEVLTDLWQAFQGEYRWVRTEALDPKHCPYLLISPHDPVKS